MDMMKGDKIKLKFKCPRQPKEQSTLKDVLTIKNIEASGAHGHVCSGCPATGLTNYTLYLVDVEENGDVLCSIQLEKPQATVIHQPTVRRTKPNKLSGIVSK